MSFCHVDNVRQSGQEIEFITLGNQKWHGTIPAFIMRASIDKLTGIVAMLVGMKDVRDILHKNILPPQHWARKYLMVASVSWLWVDKVINGRNDIRFNSIPSQIIIQLALERDSKVPRIIVDEKRNKWGMVDNIWE